LEFVIGHSGLAGGRVAGLRKQKKTKAALKTVIFQQIEKV
jgi:hypothetical protein